MLMLDSSQNLNLQMEDMKSAIQLEKIKFKSKGNDKVNAKFMILHLEKRLLNLKKIYII